VDSAKVIQRFADIASRLHCIREEFTCLLVVPGFDGPQKLKADCSNLVRFDSPFIKETKVEGQADYKSKDS
jgi:hypothetical protein